MKCKVIVAPKTFLEKEVNDWLQTEKINIVNVTQTENELGYITLTIFYLDIKETRKQKLDKINLNSN